MSLNVTVTHKSAPISTQIMRLYKAVEQFYYALLYSSKPGYQNKPETWRSWQAVGFHVAIKSAPPATAESDKITVSLRSNGKSPEISADNGDKATLVKVQRIIQQLDAARKSVGGKDQAAKADALVANKLIAQDLIKPLMDSLKKNALREDEIEAYMTMIRRGLLAFAHDDITAIQISTN